MIIFTLENLNSRKFNIIQDFISYYLYVSRIFKRVFSIFNHLELSTSYDSLRKALVTHADARQFMFKTLCFRKQTIQVNFDNADRQFNVRNERLHSLKSFKVNTAEFVSVFHNDLSMSKFTRKDANYKSVKFLTLRNFLSSIKDH